MLSVLLLALAMFGGAAAALEGDTAQVKKEVRLPHVSGKLTIAQSVVLIVEKLDLNIDHLRFIKEPKASDYFTKVDDDAAYAKHFIIAQHNGLSLDPDVDPESRITRELFAHLLFEAIMTKGEFAFINIYILIHDEDQITPEYMNSIQKLLISDIIKLDGNGNFKPKDSISLGQAYFLLHGATKFLKDAVPIDDLPQDDGEVTLTVSPVHDEVNKVTLSWGEKPNPGYRITIDRIEFTADQNAVIHYTLHYPDPDKSYIQIITEAQASTYVSSEYKPTLNKSPHSSTSTNSGSTSNSKPGHSIEPFHP